MDCGAVRGTLGQQCGEAFNVVKVEVAVGVDVAVAGRGVPNWAVYAAGVFNATTKTSTSPESVLPS